jgi:hypothetical protein
LKGEIGKAFPRERRGPEQEVTFRIQKNHSAPEINPRQCKGHCDELFLEHNHHKINATFIVNNDVLHASKSAARLELNRSPDKGADPAHRSRRSGLFPYLRLAKGPACPPKQK